MSRGKTVFFYFGLYFLRFYALIDEVESCHLAKGVKHANYQRDDRARFLT
ncbi:hypothetical protein CLOSTMETH_00106 [[Clostridium] methylpentosum DSM 5476]|uniref:Uncharacterized protein n=1 Tax=[Clostridium] methylpentosum DSM 5476 TaxID=537013 RepID=C0E8G1_9FIRM|nr:hypothetical protein CLOSTMETH_00106 [[Clostridium] methylpentosum DSM 5476]